MAEYQVEVVVKATMTKFIEADSKKAAIEKARELSGPLDNIGLGEGTIDYLWSTATAEKIS